MSIDDLINPAEEKANKEKYIKELKSKELKHDFKKAWSSHVIDEKGNILEREETLRMNLGMMYHQKIEKMTSKGQLDNLKAKTSKELEKELSDCRRLKELVSAGYSDNRKLNADYWTKAVENGVRYLDDLLKFDEDFRNGKFDNKQQEQKEQVEKLAFRNVGIDGGLINYIKMREGTTRVESKNEYKPVKNINELVDQVKSIKDSHTKIKGRAIMDMFGISADLYVKAGNIPFPIGPGAVGYCTKAYDPNTDRSSILEIGLVADRDNAVAETKTAIHECMHAQLKHSIDKTLNDYPIKSEKKKETIRHAIEETIVEVAGQGVSNLIHGNGTDKQLWSYSGIIAQVAPMIWGTPEFSEARKKGLHGIGQEICKRLIDNDTSFVQNVVDEYFESQIDNELNGKIKNRMQTIEWAITGNQNKADKIQNDTGKSEIANLVEELKKGTISLEGALNSSQYREIAAILITKFLEDEDLDVLEGAANEIKYGNADSAEMMASGRIPF